jgi:hypothetical protein
MSATYIIQCTFIAREARAHSAKGFGAEWPVELLPLATGCTARDNLVPGSD